MATKAMRIGTFNVENLFDRPKAMGSAPPDDAKTVLNAHAKLGALIGEPAYTAADKTAMLGYLEQLGLAKSDTAKYAVLRQIRGKLIRRPRSGPEITATGREDWVGWVDLVTERVDTLAMAHTGQVLREVGADIMAVVEAENRIVLKRFTDAALPDADGAPLFPHVMVIDGNDDRGIDVGVLSRPGWPIRQIRSHIDDETADGRRIFSRDCPVYAFDFPTDSGLAGHQLHVLPNHFKSKGYGNQRENNATRQRQADRVAEIYQALRGAGEEYVVVLGDLNDTPPSAPLQPLLAETDLTDVAQVDGFDDGGRPGTYANGTAGNKIDYLLLSPALTERTTGGAIFRKGIWGGKNGTLFEHFPTMTAEHHAASDHAALYADIDIS